MAEEKKAVKTYTLEDIKFKEANKTMAVLSCIPIVGLIMFFVEKDDLFVKYIGAEFALIGLLGFFTWIPIIGWLLAPAILVLVIIGMVKTSKGERFDVPLASDLALKLMGSL